MPEQPEFVDTERKAIVGVAVPEAGRSPYLIPYAWVALASRMERVAGRENTTVLYGVWDKDRAAKTARYIVGVEVRGDVESGPGLVRVVLPAMRYARMAHVGNIGRIGETFEALRPHVREGSDAAWEPTFEVYDTAQAVDDSYRVLLHEPVCYTDGD